jgi:gliding motility-associated-like protein
MRITLLSIIFLFCFFKSNAQTFSNKGTDFWVGYGYHLRMNEGASTGLNSQDMVLYFATEQVTRITITTQTGYSQVITSPATPTVVTSNPLPKSGAQDVTLKNETAGLTGENKGIHIVADKPIVAYAHIYNQSISGATILFPTNTLGKTYYSINYTQTSNENQSHCWFYVMATDTGTTFVRITPKAATLSHPANVPFVVTLTKGQVYNVMGQVSGNNGVDLTGSLIESISVGNSPCKNIAVYSGSGKLNITCTGGDNSADNYMVQAFPKAAWGKRFLTAPTSILTNNFFRICLSETPTVVRVNGVPISTPPVGGFYYEISANTPKSIEADKPVTVAQYITTRSSCGNPSTQNGDPEVIYLSPVEQNISSVLWNATNNSNILQHFFNVILPNSGTAISSFRLDGAAVPSSEFQIHPGNSSFSYLQKSINTSGAHRITSDSGFNAIAYGYGSAESYGYNAGTNIKDLENEIEPVNQFGDTLNNIPTKICANTPFYVTVRFTFQADSMNFNFGSFFPPESYPSPTVSMDSLLDTTYFDVAIGKIVWQYKIPHTFTYSVANTNPGYPITITAINPNILASECGANRLIVTKSGNIVVYGPPEIATISKVHSGCVGDPVQFNDMTGYTETPFRFSWNFGDGQTATGRTPQHLYAASGTYTVRLSTLSPFGCLSDTVRQLVVVTQKPPATFNTSNPICFGTSVRFTPTHVMAQPDTIKQWIWIYGDGDTTRVNYPSSGISNHNYRDSITFPASLILVTNSGCRSNQQTSSIVVHPVPKAGYVIPGVCLIDPTNPFAQFTDTSYFPANTITSSWFWDFGDGQTSSDQNPRHNYTTTGDLTVKLLVKNQTGCKDSIEHLITIGGAVPIPNFTFFPAADSVCEKDTVYVRNNSTVSVGRISKIIVFWDVLNPLDTSMLLYPSDDAVFKKSYPITQLVRNYDVQLLALSGGCDSSTLPRRVTVRPIPIGGFRADKQKLCLGDRINFIDLSDPVDGNLSHWYWKFENGFNSIAQNPTYTFTDTGTFQVQMFTENEGGCKSDTTSLTINVYPYPKVNAGPDEYVLEGNQIQLNATVTGSPDVFQWQMPFYLSDPTILNPICTPKDDITYTLTVTGAGGCPAQDLIRIFVLRVPEIPNTFSPNNDGKNDKWEVKYLQQYPNSKIRIFSRSGELVFESRGYQQPWDGTKKGKLLPVDTYYYIIEPDNGRSPITGYVTIIR